MGKGESEAPRGGWVGFLLREGGFPGGGGGGGAGRVSAANWGFFWGGGAKYFFSGPKRPPSFTPRQHTQLWLSKHAHSTSEPKAQGFTL